MITKEFIINEINEIKKAFKSIHENFKVQRYEPIKKGKQNNEYIDLSDVNFSISIISNFLFSSC